VIEPGHPQEQFLAARSAIVLRPHELAPSAALLICRAYEHLLTRGLPFGSPPVLAGHAGSRGGQGAGITLPPCAAVDRRPEAVDLGVERGRVLEVSGMAGPGQHAQAGPGNGAL